MNIKFTSRRRANALVAFGLLAAPCAHAGGEQVVEKIVVTGSATSPAGVADAASVGTVTQAQLEARTFYRPGEILESTPGLIVSQHSGEGKANQFYLRGFNLDHGTDLRTTVDGMLVNQRSHAHGQGWTDLNFVIPELAAGRGHLLYALEAMHNDGPITRPDDFRKLNAVLCYSEGSAIDYYYASRLPGEPAQGVNDVHFHPTETRSFRLSAILRF